MEAEAIALSRAIEACHHWIVYSDPVMFFSDCSDLLEMMDKPLADIKKVQKILEKAQNYHWETIHIS